MEIDRPMDTPAPPIDCAEASALIEPLWNRQSGTANLESLLENTADS
jgi:hypothetical protein